MKDSTVIVLDLPNYKSDYAEPCPFKARIWYENSNAVVVVSLTTNKEYEIYDHQILERLPIEQIAKLIDMSKYGSE